MLYAELLDHGNPIGIVPSEDFAATSTEAMTRATPGEIKAESYVM